MPAAVIGGVTLRVRRFRRLPDEKGGGDLRRTIGGQLRGSPQWVARGWEIFDLALRRRQAALVGAPAPAVGGGLTPATVRPTDVGGNLPAGGFTVNINNPPPGMDVDGTVRLLKRALRDDPEAKYLVQRASGVRI